MIDLIREPLQYEFMVRGFLAAIIVGVISATLGTYVVLRGMAFLGNALSHAILPGVATAAISLETLSALGAAAATAASAFGVLPWLQGRRRLSGRRRLTRVALLVGTTGRDPQLHRHRDDQPEHPRQGGLRDWDCVCRDVCPGNRPDLDCAQLQR